MSGGIYTIRFDGTMKFYVGKTCNLNKRRMHHVWCLKRGVHGNTHLQNLFNLLGAEAMRFCVEEIIGDEATRTAREQEWLDEHGKTGYLVNMIMTSVIDDIGVSYNTTGRVAWNKGLPSPTKGIPRTDAEKAAISAALIGKTLGIKRGPPSADVRSRISSSQIGKVVSEATRLAMSKAKTGKKAGPRPEGVRLKISASNKGRVFSEAHRKALSDAAKARKGRSHV